jgi:NADPH2:quinone reductase
MDANNQVKCIEVKQVGGPSVLEYVPYSIADVVLKPSQVLVRHSFAGVNFIDTYHRTGLYKKPLPFIPGTEGSGAIVKVGSDVKDARLGERVCFFSALPEGQGGYSTFSVNEADDVHPVPAAVPDDKAAAVVLQGLTAHYLTRSSYKVSEGDVVLVHAAAGGTGLLICQMAKMHGARVIGVCGSADKAALARSVGRADEVIDYSATPDWEAEVKALVPKGVDCVYDGVGKATFKKSIAVLKCRGHMISFGNASGAVEPVTPLELYAAGSIILQRPGLWHYCDKASGELQWRLGEVMKWVEGGELTLHIGKTMRLDKAQEAHELIESRGSVGKILLNCQE